MSNFQYRLTEFVNGIMVSMKEKEHPKSKKSAQVEVLIRTPLGPFGPRAARKVKSPSRSKQELIVSAF